jgi:hypothetical protein
MENKIESLRKEKREKQNEMCSLMKEEIKQMLKTFRNKTLELSKLYFNETERKTEEFDLTDFINNSIEKYIDGDTDGDPHRGFVTRISLENENEIWLRITEWPSDYSSEDQQLNDPETIEEIYDLLVQILQYKKEDQISFHEKNDYTEALPTLPKNKIQSIPIAFLDREGIREKGFDSSKITDGQLKEIADKLRKDYQDIWFSNELNEILGAMGMKKKSLRQHLLPFREKKITPNVS